MKRKFKILSLLFIITATFFVGNTITRAAVTPQKFQYNYEYYVSLPKDLKIGENNVVISSRATEKGILLEDVTVSYKITEVTKEEYEKFKVLQESLDKKREAQTLTGDDSELQQFEKLVADGKYWCYDDYKVGKIVLDKFCDTKYFVVTVDVYKANATGFPTDTFDYMDARAYEVTGEECPQPTPPENPKTGIASPYIALGGITIVSIAAIVVMKNKKFM